MMKRKTNMRRMVVAQPKYEAGQKVQMLGSRSGGWLPAHGRVVRALPSSGGPIQYRVKSEGEAFERVVDEARLTGVSEQEAVSAFTQ